MVGMPITEVVRGVRSIAASSVFREYMVEEDVDTLEAAIQALESVTAPTEPVPPQTINGFTLEDWFKIAQGKDKTVGVCVAAIDELAEAIRFTVEYVGNDTLPALEGWSWFDALMKHRPEIAEEFRRNPILLHAKSAPTEVRGTPATGEAALGGDE